ncbi:hypothetical protein [Mobilitalea sibirica]|nr:hypothetical protein [Mobilitalea sibirica]
MYSFISFYALLMQILIIILLILGIYALMMIIKALQVYIRKNS